MTSPKPRSVRRHWAPVAAILFAFSGLGWAIAGEIVFAGMFTVLACATIVVFNPRASDSRADDQTE